MKADPSKTPLRLLACTGFVATAFAGWHLAGGSAPPAVARQEATMENAKNAKASTRTDRSVRKDGPSAEARRKIAAIRAIKSPQERMRATIALAQSLPASELGEWIDKRWFISEPGFDLTLFNKIVNQRWQTEDPQGKLKLALESGENYSSSALQGWAKQDPSAVLAWFKENPNRDLETQTLAEIAKTDPALAFSRLRELMLQNPSNGWGGGYNYYTNETLKAIADKSPQTLTAALDGLPDKLRRQVEGMLLGKRLGEDPAGEIHNLMGKPDGLKSLQAAMNQSGENWDKVSDMILGQLSSMPDSWRQQLGQGALNVVSAQNAEKWFNADFAAAGFTPEQAKSVRLMALQQFVYNKPEQAIKMMAELDLSDQERQSMVTNLFAYGRDAKKTEELLAMLPSDEDRQAANEFMSQNGVSSRDPQEEIKAETPAEWFEAAQGFNPDNGMSYYLAEAMSKWDKSKQAEFAAEFRKLPAEQKRNAALALVGDGDNLGNNPELKGEALGYLLSLPPAAPAEPSDTEGSGMFQVQRQQDYSYAASSFAVHWGMKDPEGATQWIQTLPDGDGKLWVQKNLAANWTKYDPDATQQWLGTLPTTSRTAIEKFMKNPNGR